MSNTTILDRLQLVTDYFSLLIDADYKIIDLNMIEPFYLEDKAYHPSNIVFERNHEMQAIRSDWTRSLLNYKNSYHLEDNKLGYFGPVIRENQTIYQAGVEMYEIAIDEIIESILMHFEFIEEQSEIPPKIMIVNDEKLIDTYLAKYQLDEKIKELIYDKDISSLKNLLGDDHPVYRLMIAPVSQQFDLIAQEFNHNEVIEPFQKLKEKLRPYHIKFILDLSFRSPQRYYNGFYFQLFLDENVPVLSGGEYDEHAFGIAINLSKGDLL